MSHFVVMVTNTDNEPLDSQLERFYEQGEEGDYFMEKEYVLERGTLEEVKDYVKNNLKIFNDNLEHCKEENKDYWQKCIKRANKQLKMKDANKLLEDIAEDECYSVDEKGMYYVSNPNAKWDWWTIGGRWDGWLVKKDGTRCNTCKVKDLSLEKMSEAEKEDAARYYDEEVARSKEANRKPFFWNYQETPTREQYIKDAGNRIAPYAVLDEDEWYEKATMGWWGISSNEKDPEEWEKWFKDWLGKLDPETEITIVDCHI